VTGIQLRFEREYEFSPTIVWAALVDADLVSGWLAEATVVPEVGGEFNLQWSHRVGQPTTLGRVTVLHPLERLDVDTATMGRWQFDLREIPGGSRGTSTQLTLTVDVELEPVFAPRVRADWLTNLDQLEDLLRGHPVDWSHWDRDRHDSWTQHLGDAENSFG